jgi:hypothetical protein
MNNISSKFKSIKKKASCSKRIKFVFLETGHGPWEARKELIVNG